ncbi:MAG: hypothetical protein WCV79_01895 [Candidatus Paceibacterota bacterium]
MKAIIKVSGVPADGLGRLDAYLKGPDVSETPEGKKRLVTLKDARLEENHNTFLVTVDVLIVDVGTVPKERICVDQFRDFFRSLDPRSLPEFDIFGDGDRVLQELKQLLGKIAPFDVSDPTTGLVMLQKGQKITSRRLEELVEAGNRRLVWECEGKNEDTTLLENLLNWIAYGGVRELEFPVYVRRYGKTKEQSSSVQLPCQTEAYFPPLVEEAPNCPHCGHKVVPTGACWKCLNCGESLGGS